MKINLNKILQEISKNYLVTFSTKAKNMISLKKNYKNIFFFSNNGLNNWTEILFNKVLEILGPMLEPVSVDYSNKILASQIYGISILLFILSVLIIILLIAFIINIIILLYSDKLMEIFTNKYIRWYIFLNKKMIGIEICFLGASILYFMYILSYGLHFLATHPITIN